MPTRSPVVANQFYPGSREALESMLDELFRPFTGKRPASAPFIFMLPHAGYIFSGFMPRPRWKASDCRNVS